MRKQQNVRMIPISEPMKGITSVIIVTGKRITFNMVPTEHEKDVLDLISRINKKFVKQVIALNKKRKRSLGTCCGATTVPPPERRKS